MNKKFAYILLAMPAAHALWSGDRFPKGFEEKQTVNKVTFTENIGQVYDQYDRPRRDIRYTGTAAGIDYRLRDNGISYQLYKVVNWKTRSEGDRPDRIPDTVGRTPALIDIFRVDFTWLNCNSNIVCHVSSPETGYSNFYNCVSPEGALYAKSFQSVCYKNVYEGVDVRYYGADGKLKCDYMISPNTDYRKIRIKIGGANRAVLNLDGSISIHTPLGIISEDRPVGLQGGVQVKVEWTLNNDCLGFIVHDYDNTKALIIDPVVRLWGTYYGGNAGESWGYCATDQSGNVFLSGRAASTNAIATTGSHQVTKSGTIDAFIAKFDPNGTRLWGTYYGGTDDEEGHECAADRYGNVFLVGDTRSTSSVNVIATQGAHQTSLFGVQDAFAVKFNGNGVRIWGTYYGGNVAEYGYCVSTDTSGNVFLAGETTTYSGTMVATSNGHQTNYPGLQITSFLAKFDSSGARQWGTYYGGMSGSRTTGCATDRNGNVFMSGHTQSQASIATTGSHQSSLNASMSAYLVKFNPGGVRQWATYYGGTVATHGEHCATDLSGNVFLVGEADAGADVITPGCHQSAFGGGTGDVYVAKFSPSGVRIWSTFYGGDGTDLPKHCVTDSAGSVFVTGSTTTGFISTSSATAIATGGSHQTLHGGGVRDVFLAKFSPSGALLWGTFYGGNSHDYAHACAVDRFGHSFLSGQAGSLNGTTIATPGSHQPLPSGNDIMLVKFDETCPVPLTPTVTASSSLVCTGDSVVFTASANGVISWYNSPTASLAIATGYTFIPNSMAPGTYTFYAETFSCTPGNSRAPIVVTVEPTPTVTAASGSICAGDTFSILPSGAASYSFSGGSGTVNPNVTSIYSVTGTSSAGCVSASAAVVTVTVHSLPVIAVNSGSVCGGGTFTINASGGATYTYSGGSPVVSPSVTTNYSVTGTNSAGCVSSPAAISTVVVSPAPVVSASGGAICFGSAFTITPSGAGSYTYSGGTSIVSPTVTTTYSVIGMNADGCLSLNPAIVTVTVLSTPTLNVNGPNAVCLGEPAILSAAGAASYTWSTGHTTAVISISPTVNTVYQVAGADTSGCEGSGSHTVTVKPLPGITVNSTSVCTGQQATLSATTGTSATTYTWQTGTSNAPLTVNPSSTSVYSVEASLNGCKSSATATVFVLSSIIPVTTFSYTTYCAEMLHAIPSLVSGFSPGGTFSVSPPLVIDASSGLVELSGAAPGNYSVTYQLPASGCSLAATANALISIVLSSSLNLQPEVTVLAGSSVTLSAAGASSYSWSPPDWLSCVDCPAPVASPPQTTRYCVTSPAETCISETCVLLIVDEESPCSPRRLNVPNAFSPNNDGQNDDFLLEGWSDCVSSFSFMIFDRWGEKLFESRDPAFRWNGKYKGKVPESDVLVYVLKATFMNGGSENRKGNITLIR